MYISYSDLVQTGIFIVALIGLCYTYLRAKRNEPPTTAIVNGSGFNTY